jgi:hypothetical protein
MANNLQVFSYYSLTIKNHFMAKYSRKAGEKVEEEMHEMKEGKLKTGTGKKVTNPKQAIAIGLSEARKEGAKIPKRASAKKAATKKASATKAGTKKAASKKSS